MKLSAVIEGYWLDKKLRFSKATIQGYAWVFRLLTDYLGDMEFEAITANDIRRFLAHQATDRNLSRRSIHDIRARLSSLWSWAEQELGAPHIIRGRVQTPRYTEKKIEPFTQEEVKQLLKGINYSQEWETATGKITQSQRPTADRDRAIVLTLLDSGVRASELCALTLRDYDRKRGRLYIRHGKGDKERFAVVGNRTQKAIWRYLAGRTDTQLGAPLFSTKTGQHMDRNNLRHTLKGIGKRSGVHNVHPHKFRHTFAINFLRNGGNVFLLKELLGHESLEMVMHYARIAEQDLDAGQKHSPADNWKL
ncbi:MAG: tyrosine-type recombinase/integrase [Caldilineaceae bacterium]|nr:tyrosine-type recombinase/integrase [Caldilineaceae bacterium]